MWKRIAPTPMSNDAWCRRIVKPPWMSSRRVWPLMRTTRTREARAYRTRFVVVAVVKGPTADADRTMIAPSCEACVLSSCEAFGHGGRLWHRSDLYDMDAGKAAVASLFNLNSNTLPLRRSDIASVYILFAGDEATVSRLVHAGPTPGPGDLWLLCRR